MRLMRRSGVTAAISLTPLVDVMLILLVFFMVTSTYLDLDMIPVGRAGEASGVEAEAPSASAALDPAGAGTLLIRIDAAGRPVFRGRALDAAGLADVLEGRRRALILPSGAATAQDLVRVMEAVARAGVADARIVRLEARP